MNDPLSRIAATERKLAEACRESGVRLSADGRVSEMVAAGLLGLAPGTLKNRRCEGAAPPHYQLAGRGGKISYSLHDLATFIESLRCG
jgi:hypothetical protein